MFGWGAADSKEGGTYVLSKTYGIKFKKVVQDVEMGSKGGKGKADNNKQYETFQTETPSADYSHSINTKDGEPPSVCFVFQRYASNEQTLYQKIIEFFTCTAPEPKDLFTDYTPKHHTDNNKNSDTKKKTDFDNFLESLTKGPNMMNGLGVAIAGDYKHVEATAEDGKPYPKGSPDAKVFVLFTPTEAALRVMASENNELLMMNEGKLDLKFKDMEERNKKAKSKREPKIYEIPSDVDVGISRYFRKYVFFFIYPQP